jgi:hypothetical protein
LNFFSFQFAQTSACKNQTAPIFLFSTCCCQGLPLTFASFSLSFIYLSWWLFKAWEEPFQNSSYPLN